jgi:hypothetical protein
MDMKSLNDLAYKLVGTDDSPYFVTLINELEFDGSPLTVAAFCSITDAVKFVETFQTNANETLIIEGPMGIYFDSREDKVQSFA